MRNCRLYTKTFHVAHRLCPGLDSRALDSQLVELRQTGCSAIYEEHASGADRTRLAFARLLAAIRPSDMLVVVRLDRLARSLTHLP
jgi:DNA invertase Pin-like site-specific DNA recombinase